MKLYQTFGYMHSIQSVKLPVHLKSTPLSVEAWSVKNGRKRGITLSPPEINQGLINAERTSGGVQGTAGGRNTELEITLTRNQEPRCALLNDNHSRGRWIPPRWAPDENKIRITKEYILPC